MMDAINPLLLWLNDHPHWAGVATFIISSLESVAIVGTIVPGTIMMTAIGALAGAGVIPLWFTLFCAILGAIVGDGVSYLIGHYFKSKIPHVWPFRNHPEWLQKGETFFHKHGGKSVFIGRFVGPVRALIPMIAGMLGMKPLRFYVSNIVSAIGWAPAYMLPGILLGAASLELPPDIAVHAMLMLLLVTLFIIFCIWAVVKIFALIGYKIDQSLNQFWHLLQNSRYAKFITIALKHHDKHYSHGQLVLAFYFIIVTTVFVLLAHEITQYGSASFAVNDIMLHLFRSFHSPIGNNIMLSLTLFGEKSILLPTIFVVIIWLTVTKRYYMAWHVLMLGVLTVGSTEVIKHYVHSVRPWGTQSPPLSFSFPSGHAVLVTTFFMGFALLLSQAYPSRQKFFCYSALIFAFLVSISRIYLGVHWFTDVFAGWLLSAALLLFVSISYNRKKINNSLPPRLIRATLLTLLIAYGIAFLHYFERYQKQTSMIDYPSYTIPMATWWQQGDPHTPVYRIGRFGIAEQIFNIQWVGDLKNIQHLLLQNNWEIPPERDWISVVQRITDVESTEHLPLVSPLYLDKKPVLVLIKHTENKKRVLVLRLWDSNISIQPGNHHLWAGTISIIPRTYNWIFRKKSNEVEINPDLIFENSYKHFQVKEIQLSLNKRHRRLPSNPVILLIKPKS
jgi:membrane protein DedA with SNARE-associated domain